MTKKKKGLKSMILYEESGQSLILPLHTFTFSAALSWWFVRVAALSVTGHLCADDLPSVTVTYATGVVAISKLSAIRIFFTMKHAACKQKIGVPNEN